jgi:hypothetical protein
MHTLYQGLATQARVPPLAWGSIIIGTLDKNNILLLFKKIHSTMRQDNHYYRFFFALYSVLGISSQCKYVSISYRKQCSEMGSIKSF